MRSTSAVLAALATTPAADSAALVAAVDGDASMWGPPEGSHRNPPAATSTTTVAVATTAATAAITAVDTRLYATPAVLARLATTTPAADSAALIAAVDAFSAGMVDDELNTGPLDRLGDTGRRFFVTSEPWKHAARRRTRTCWQQGSICACA